jgi:hypothetical protein
MATPIDTPQHAAPEVTYSRRTLLRATPALLAPAILPSSALASNALAQGISADTPILALFREWEAAEVAANDPSASEDEQDASIDLSCEIEKRIVAEPVTCLLDLAAKIVANSSYGDFKLDASVVAEAEALLAEVLA